MKLANISLILLIILCMALYIYFSDTISQCAHTVVITRSVNSSDVSFHVNRPYKSFICNPKMKKIGYSWPKNRLHLPESVRSYCSKIPNPTSHWRKPTRYQESDIAFVIITAVSLYTSRAMTIRETWASRVTHYYFLASKPYPMLPVTIVKDTGEDYQSNTKKIFHGLESLYTEQKAMPPSKRHKWYVIVGCDTYVNALHLIKQLEPYDFTKPHFIGGSVGEALCFHKNGTAYTSLFVGGNTAHIYSAALLEHLYPFLSFYVESVWPQPNHTSAAFSDVALSCLIFSLGYNMTIIPGLWRRSPDGIIEQFGLKNLLRVQEPSSWHYINPVQMIDLDEFYTFQYIDRLINDQNWNELLEFTQLFVVTHYAILRNQRMNDSQKHVSKY